MAAVAAYMLAGVLGVSSIMKIAAPTSFRGSLSSYHMFGSAQQQFLVVVVPAVEAATALALLVPTTRTLGSALAAVILILFTAVLVTARWRGLRVSCGCFGAGRSVPVSLFALARNAFLLAAALAGFFVASPDHPSLGALVVLASVVAVGAFSEFLQVRAAIGTSS